MTGAAIGSAVGGILGSVSSSKDADAAMESGEAALDNGMAAIMKQIEAMRGANEDAGEFYKGLMEDWEGTFGGIQDNLSDYYNNLDPSKFATQGKANLQQSMDKAIGQMNEQFAANGMQTAGQKQQMEFLASGESQRNMAQGGMGQTLNNAVNIEGQGMSAISGMFGAQSSMYQNMSAQHGADAGGFLSGGLGLAGGLLGTKQGQKEMGSWWGD